MKYLKKCLMLSILLVSFCVSAQKPEKIYSIVRVIKPNEYYLQQMELWKKEIDKDKLNADAWFNYYKANRYAQISQPGDSVAIPSRFERLNKIVAEMGHYIPQTFEANFVRWWNGYNNEDLFPYLEKAYQIDSNRAELHADWVNHYEMRRDINQKERFLKKWYESGNASPGLLQYNYNMLVSLKPNAILITGGDNDTYFAWMLQAVFGIRKDVMVINTSLLTLNQAYAAHLAQELKADIAWEKESMDWAMYHKTLLKKLYENKGQRPLYTAVTAYPSVTETHTDKLYLEGLVYEYAEQKIDNIALIKKNLEREYLLDYLEHHFVQDPYQTVVPYMNTSYIVPMLTLYEHYKNSGEMEQAKIWKQRVLLVAERGGKGNDVKDYFKE